MIRTKSENREMKDLMSQYEAKKIVIESHIALLSDLDIVPVSFVVQEDFQLIPSNIVSGGIATWRIYFSDEESGIMAAQNSWRRGAVMINHAHSNYEEFIYVIHGKLKNMLTGEEIIPPEAAQILQGDIKATEVLQQAQGWYNIPAGQDHTIAALEDSEFVVKFVRTCNT